MVINNVYREIEQTEGLKLPEHSVHVPTKIKDTLTEEKHSRKAITEQRKSFTSSEIHCYTSCEICNIR